MTTRNLVLTLAAVLAALATTSWAIDVDPQGAPTTVTVQGKLTGSGGALISPGAYTFEFRIFNAEVGGMKVWPEVESEDHVITLQSDGLWTAYLGKDHPLEVRFVDDTARWLEVTVRPPVGMAETFARVKLASAPFALEAAQLNGKTGVEYLAQVGDTVGGSLHFDRNGDGVLDARIDLSLSDAAILTFYQSGMQTVRLRGDGYGELDLFDEDGTRTVHLNASTFTGGGLSLYKEDGFMGMILQGGSTTDGATLDMWNAQGTTTIALDADITGNDGVVLPQNAISALEERDEPGVANNNATTLIDLDGTVQTLLSRSITAPAAGYVLVIGTLTIDITHLSGVFDEAVFAVSNQSGSIPSGQNFKVLMEAALPTGPYQQVVTVHGLFSVGEGLSTLYLLGRELTGTFQVRDRQLTVAFFPTAYGDAPPPLVAAMGQDRFKRGAVTTPGLSAQDIAAEQAAAQVFHTARIERELATLRAELQALTERLRVAESARPDREGGR
ncbi:MAG: hypothetical protein AB1792_01570 [Candidatus Zixiibacteriota bacterium]